MHIWKLSKLSARTERVTMAFFNNVFYFSYPNIICKSNTGAGVEWDNMKRLFSTNRLHKITKKDSSAGTQAAVALKGFTVA